MLTAAARRLIEPYRGLPATTYVQAVCSLINYMGGMAKLFLPLYLHESYGVSYAWIGVLVSCYGAGALLGSFAGGALSDRYRGDRLVTGAMACSAATLFALSRRLPLWVFVPVLITSGVSDGAFRPINERLALEPCPPERQPMAQGMLRVLANLGSAAGGAIAGLLARRGFQLVYVADAAAAFLTALWTVWAYRGAAGPVLAAHGAAAAASGPAPGQGRGPWRDGPFLVMLGCLLTGILVFDQMNCTVGLFLRGEYEMGSQWLGYVFTVNGLLVVLFQVPLARRIPQWGVTTCAHVGLLLVGGAYPVLLLSPGPAPVLVAAAVYTFGEILMIPAYLQVVMIRSEGRLRGQYMGLYHAAWGGRALVAPALGTWLYGLVGGRALWWTCAAAAAVAAALQARVFPALLGQRRALAPSGLRGGPS